MSDETRITSLSILLVEDSETDAYAVRRALSKHMEHPCRVRHVECIADAGSVLQNESDIDLILLDLGLPDSAGGADSFQKIDQVRNNIPVIILTSVHDHDLAVSIIDKGAEDYVRKSSISVDPEVLCEAIDFAVCRHQNVEELKEQAHQELEEKNKVISWMSGGYSVDSNE